MNTNTLNIVIVYLAMGILTVFILKITPIINNGRFSRVRKWASYAAAAIIWPAIMCKVIANSFNRK